MNHLTKTIVAAFEQGSYLCEDESGYTFKIYTAGGFVFEFAPEASSAEECLKDGYLYGTDTPLIPLTSIIALEVKEA